jgi:hypothetical protein
MDKEDKFTKTMYNNLDKYFDPYEFNKDFDEYIKKTEESSLLTEKVKLTDINNIENKKIEPYEEPVGHIAVGIKNTWFVMFDNLIHGKHIFNTMDNRNTFYFAISFIIFALLYMMISFIFNQIKKIEKNIS